MVDHAFKQVDVFTKIPFLGNPVAVVFDADDLSEEQMRRIARWTNLSETTFVLRPTGGADYRLRIFTPASELPFAGHPTIGTAHALLEAGRVSPTSGLLVQECAKGLVRLFVEPTAISFELPKPSTVLLTEPQIDELEQALGAEILRDPVPRLIDVGARWIVAQMAGAREVLDVRPDFARLARQDRAMAATGVTIFGPHHSDSSARLEVRSFAPSDGVDEDPVCGSGNGSVAAFIRETDQVSVFGSSYVASQGSVVGRGGRIQVSVAEQIWIGGAAVTCVDGRLTTSS